MAVYDTIGMSYTRAYLDPALQRNNPGKTSREEEPIHGYRR